MNTIKSKRNREMTSSGRKLLVGYFLAGYPDRKSFLRILKNAEQAGIDIFEIGVPSEDPFDDGDVIRKAHRATDQTIRSDPGYWQEIRGAVSGPVWMMGYKGDIRSGNVWRAAARERVIDALMIPDMDIDERLAMSGEIGRDETDVIGSVGPSTGIAEQVQCFLNFPLIYQRLYDGPTGMTVETDHFEEILKRGHSAGGNRLFAGFGISTPERVRFLTEKGFDGVIIGTAMLKKLNDSEEELYRFISDLRKACDGGRTK